MLFLQTVFLFAIIKLMHYCLGLVFIINLPSIDKSKNLMDDKEIVQNKFTQ